MGGCDYRRAGFPHGMHFELLSRTILRISRIKIHRCPPSVQLMLALKQIMIKISTRHNTTRTGLQSKQHKLALQRYLSDNNSDEDDTGQPLTKSTLASNTVADDKKCLNPTIPWFCF
jgi:hypothetical protein